MNIINYLIAKEMENLKIVELDAQEVESMNGGFVGKKGIWESIVDSIKSTLNPSPTFPRE